MSIKTNKSLRSRVRATKKGKLVVRGKGQGHLNGKVSRKKQLSRKRDDSIQMSNKTRQRFITKNI